MGYFTRLKQWHGPPNLKADAPSKTRQKLAAFRETRCSLNVLTRCSILNRKIQPTSWYTVYMKLPPRRWFLLEAKNPSPNQETPVLTKIRVPLSYSHDPQHTSVPEPVQGHHILQEGQQTVRKQVSLFQIPVPASRNVEVDPLDAMKVYRRSNGITQRIPNLGTGG
jgi:hypothetical protein